MDALAIIQSQSIATVILAVALLLEIRSRRKLEIKLKNLRENCLESHRHVLNIRGSIADVCSAISETSVKLQVSVQECIEMVTVSLKDEDSRANVADLDKHRHGRKDCT